MIEFVPASPAHVGTIALRMREIDRLECAIMGRTPKQALRASLMASSLAWTAKVDGRPEAMFGAAAVSLMDREGSPWLLLTEAGAREAKSLVRDGRRYADLMQAEYSVLANVVHADNHLACRWLERLGFTLGETFAMHGHRMRRFERRAGDNRCANRLLS